MDFPLTLLKLAGAIAMLLWGVHMVQSGFQRAFGAKLRSFLGRTLRNRFSAFLAGVGVTAVLQSSTATGLMVTGFACTSARRHAGGQRRHHADCAATVIRCC